MSDEAEAAKEIAKGAAHEGSVAPRVQSGELIPAIRAALQNGDRLAEDARSLIDWERFPTAYALAILAQEEFAKALLLSLVDAGAIPWSSDVRRALNDHICKQLASVILDYLSPEFEEWLRRHDHSCISERKQIFPVNVLDAIHVICNERIPRERDRWWLDSSDRPLDTSVSAIALGRIDRKKQDALYVRLAKSGRVLSDPSTVSRELAIAETERSERIGQQLRPYDRPPGLAQDDLDSEKLVGLFKLLTGGITPEEFASYWWAR